MRATGALLAAALTAGETVWREVVGVSRAADTEVKALPRPPAQAAIIERLIAGYFEEARDEDNIANAFGSGSRVAVQTAYATFLVLARRDAAVARSLGMIACAKAESEPGVPGPLSPVRDAPALLARRAWGGYGDVPHILMRLTRGRESARNKRDGRDDHVAGPIVRGVSDDDHDPDRVASNGDAEQQLDRRLN